MRDERHEYQSLLKTYKLPDNFLIEPEGLWFFEERITNDSVEPIHFSLTPFVIVGQATTRDSDEKSYVVLAWQTPESPSFYLLPAEITFSGSCTNRLAKYGFKILSKHANLIAQYLFESYHLNSPKLWNFIIGTKGGWQQISPTQHAYLYGNQIFTDDNTLAFPLEKALELNDLALLDDGVLSNSDKFLLKKSKLVSACDASGGIAGWREIIPIIKDCPKILFQLGSTFAAPILDVLDVPNFIVHSFAETSCGKTTILRLCASVVGKPTTGNNGTIYTWQTTPNGIEALAREFSDYPMFLDEIGLAVGTSSEKRLDNFIYQIGIGQCKNRALSNGRLAEVGSFRTVLLSTGERSLATSRSPKGAEMRCIELAGNPFGTEKPEQKSLVRRINQIISCNYGVAASLFIRFLVQDRNTPQAYKDLVALFRSRQQSLLRHSGDDAYSNRISAYFGVVWLALNLADQYLELSLGWQTIEAAVLSVWQETLTRLREEGAPHLKAIKHVWNLIISNQRRFGNGKASGTWGRVLTFDNGEIGFVFFPEILKAQLIKENFEPRIILPRFIQNRYVKLTPDGHLIPVRFLKQTIRSYVFTADLVSDLDIFVDDEKANIFISFLKAI